MKLFNKAEHTQKPVDVRTFADALKNGQRTLFQPAQATNNTTNQSFVTLSGVVISSVDGTDQGKKVTNVRIAVISARDDQQMPALDFVDAGALKAMLVTERIANPDKDNKHQMPRFLASKTTATLLQYADIRMYAQPGKAAQQAIDFPTGIKVTVTGTHACVGTKSPVPYIRARAITVAGEMDDPEAGFAALVRAVYSPYQQGMAVLAAAPLFGGMEALVNEYPYLGTVLEGMRETVQGEFAKVLAAKVTNLSQTFAGEGQAYQTPVIPQGCDIVAHAASVKDMPAGTPLTSMMGTPVVHHIPIVIEPLMPNEGCVRAHSTLLHDCPEWMADFRLIGDTTSVTVTGNMVKTFIRTSLSLHGARAMEACGYDQSPLTTLPGPTMCFKKSLREWAVLLDTRSTATAQMLCEELLPHMHMVLVMPAYSREPGDRLFGDFAQGVNWSSASAFDIVNAIRHVGIKVSRKFAEIYADGGSTITELDLSPTDVIQAPVGPDVPTRVAMKTHGFVAANQRSTNIERLAGDRLPAGKPDVEFFVVFKGSAKSQGLSCQTMDTEEGESTVKHLFQGGDLADSLMKNTVLYAVARGSVLRARPEDTPLTSDADAGASEDTGEGGEEPNGLEEAAIEDTSFQAMDEEAAAPSQEGKKKKRGRA